MMIMMIIKYNIGSGEDLDKKVTVSFLPACTDTGSHWCTEERCVGANLKVTDDVFMS